MNLVFCLNDRVRKMRKREMVIRKIMKGRCLEEEEEEGLEAIILVEVAIDVQGFYK